jgi:hypothetical protein
VTLSEFPCLHCGGRHEASRAEAEGWDWPAPLCPHVNPDDVDAEAVWQRWVNEGDRGRVSNQ